MKRLFFLYFTMCFGIDVLLAEAVGTQHVVDCGTWMQLTATPVNDYHFVRWSDDNTDPVRQIQVHEDAHYIAFFAANCEEYANWPLVTYYDWLIVLNVRAINEQGYYVSPEQVRWYRIVGEPDDMHNVFPQDDKFVCTGYSLTIDRNLWGTGDYYCVADASSNQGVLCDGLMRSEIAHFSGSQKYSPLYLTPNYVAGAQTMQLRGLNPSEQNHIAIYSTSGRLIEQFVVEQEENCPIVAPIATGCYIVRVESNTYSEVFRFIVSH